MRESICDDFDAAVIEALEVDVDIAHENIAGNGSPGFAANTGSSSLEREATGAQDARAGASSAVVVEGVQWDGGSDRLHRRAARASEAGGAAKRGKQAADSIGEGAQTAGE